MSNDNTTNADKNDDDTEAHAMIKVRPFLPDAEVADDTEGNCFKYGTDLPDTGSVRQAKNNNSEPAADGDDTEGHFGRYGG